MARATKRDITSFTGNVERRLDAQDTRIAQQTQRIEQLEAKVLANANLAGKVVELEKVVNDLKSVVGNLAKPLGNITPAPEPRKKSDPEDKAAVPSE